MKLFTFTPYAAEGETFAQAINRHMELIGKDDVAIICDHDTQWTTNDWYPRLVAHAERGVQFGTCLTNRIYSGFQIAENAPEGDDLRQHWEFGHKLATANDGVAEIIQPGGKRMSGVLMLITRKAWDIIWPLKTETILELDNEIHTKMEEAGIPLHLMKDIYIYHRYRFGDRTDTAHLQVVKKPDETPKQVAEAEAPTAMRKVCYTVITGRYDQVQQPQYLTQGWEYLLFTDEPEHYKASAGNWTIVPLEKEADPRLLQRRIKIVCPISPEKGQLLRTIYVDGNQTIIGNLDYLVAETNHRKGGITVKKHPQRDCAYDEAKAVLELGKDTEKNVKRATDWLKKAKHPKNAGLTETGILIRDYTDTNGRGRLSLAMKVWYAAVRERSHRDQLSFDCVMAKHPKIELNRVDHTIFESLLQKVLHLDPHAPKATQQAPVPTVNKTDERPFSERFEMNIFTTVKPEQVGMIPFFIQSALSTNPKAHVEVWMTDQKPTPDLSELIDQWPGQFLVRQTARLRDDTKGHFANHRYLMQPEVKTTYVFLPSIDVQINAPILPLMKARMEESGLSYSNAWRLNTEDRMLPDHFTEYDAFWPHPFDPEEPSVHDCNPELLLGRIVRSKNPPPTEKDRPRIGRQLMSV